MGILDSLKDQSSNIMDDPEKRAKIEELARDRNISIDEAKDHFMKHDNK